MSKLIFRLRDVPTEEAESVRSLLKENNIEFYETSAGNWGISLAGIWVVDNSQADTARNLINAYQQSLGEAFQHHDTPGLFTVFKAQPLKYILSLLFIGVILYFSIKPFLSFGD